VRRFFRDNDLLRRLYESETIHVFSIASNRIEDSKGEENSVENPMGFNPYDTQLQNQGATWPIH